MSNTTYIYGLYCPIKEQFFYVGRSKEPVARLEQHLRDAKPTSMHMKFPHLYEMPKLRQSYPDQKTCWIAWLLQQGAAPELIVLEQVDGTGRRWATEKAWIARLFEAGHPLTNQNGIIDTYDDELLQAAIERGRTMFGTD